MKKFDFILCYDISDKKRLSKVAKYLESQAIRIQKSIFLFKNESKESLLCSIEKVSSIINEKDDDVRVYKISISKSLSLYNAIKLDNPIIIKE